MITMGARQSQGLFVFPMAGSTGVGIVTISFAMAVGQFMWGLAQPIAGALADRFGAARVLIGGVLILAVGTALTPFLTSSLGLVLTIGVFTAMGSGAGSFSVLIGSLSRYLPPAARGTAAGIIDGRRFLRTICLRADHAKVDFAVGMDGRHVVAGCADLVGVAAGAAPRRLDEPWRSDRVESERGHARGSAQRFRQHAATCSCTRGFFTCGFHIAFLVTHLPGEVALCGLPASAWRAARWPDRPVQHRRQPCGRLRCSTRYRMKDVLFWMYGSRRAVIIVLYLRRRKPR